MKPTNSASANHGRYRVTIESTDWYEVDLYAPSGDEALAIAETIDGGLVTRLVDGEWMAVSAEEASAWDFDPVNEPDATSTPQ